MPNDTFPDGPGLDSVYANGFQIGHGNADVVIEFKQDGEPCVKVRMSFTLVKTLAQLAGNLVQRLESATGMDIKTTQDIDKAFAAETSTND